MDILAPLQDNGFQSQSQEFQRSKQAGRAGTHDDYRRRIPDFPIRFRTIRLISFRRTVSLDPVAPDHLLTGIQRAFGQDTPDRSPFRKTQLPARFRGHLLLGQRPSDRYGNLYLFHRKTRLEI